MQNMLSVVEAEELVPGGESEALGKALSRKIGAIVGGLDNPITDESDFIKVNPVATPVRGYSPVEPRLARFIDERRTRHDRKDAVTEPERVARRRDALARELDAARFAAMPADLVNTGAAHFGAGALALDVAEVVAALAARGHGVTSELERRTLAAIEGGTFFPFDCAGAELDRKAEEAAREAERAQV